MLSKSGIDDAVGRSEVSSRTTIFTYCVWISVLRMHATSVSAGEASTKYMEFSLFLFPSYTSSGNSSSSTGDSTLLAQAHLHVYLYIPVNNAKYDGWETLRGLRGSRGERERER